MGIVFRQSVKTSITVFLGAFLGALVVWMSTQYIPDKRQLGFYSAFTIYAVTLSQVLILGLNSTLSVYIHKYAGDSNKKKLLITLCLLFPFLFTVLFTAGYFLLKNQVTGILRPEDMVFMQRYFMWLPIYTLFVIYQTLLEQYLSSQMKVAVAAFMREVVLRILNIILLLLLGFRYIEFSTFVIATILVYLLPVSVFFILALKTKDFGFSFRLNSFSTSEYKDMIHFSWYHFLLFMAMTLMYYMDLLVLPIYDKNGYSSVAIYRVAAFLIVVMQLPSKALIAASFPMLAKAFADEDHPKAKDIFVRSSVNLLIATVGISLILCCNLQNAVAVIKNGYSEIIPVFLILFIGNIFNIATGMNDQVLSIAKYYKFNFYISLILIVILFGLLRFLIPRYGIYGAAWSTTTTIVIFNILKCFFIWKKLDMQPFSGKTVLIVIAAIPALAAGYFFPYLFEPGRHVYVHTFIDTIMRSSIVLLVYALMLLWLKPSPDLTEYLASIKKNKRLF
jgi:O-antigen/teichoic acid export membrane protein